ncbi:DNA ligase [Campylobacter showae]|uniref:DNA ligase n=1 Tax=Campylobacter showae TaxID=204 RepID=UPI000F096FD9|nr:DNA ligase [Campylobacter showae]
MRFFALLLAAFLNLALAAQSENLNNTASADVAKNAKFELLKLSEYKGQNVGGWLASEKLDGVRAYWDGRNLRSRNGKILAAPEGWSAHFPPFALDGELYTARGEFEKIQSIVMDKMPSVAAWSEIKFHVFDVPEAGGGLLERLSELEKFIAKNPQAGQNLKIIKQIKVKDNAEFEAFAEQIVAKGGEGAVAREPNAPYERKRSKNALKYKKFKDAECEVTAINAGTGKYAGLMGSVTCKALSAAGSSSDEQNDELLQPASGVKFKIGSGFSDEERANPPKIGSIITYKYQNLTAKGLPRFPVFLRVRED